MEKNTLCSVKNLSVNFSVKNGIFQKVVGEIKAVDDVSLEIYEGEVFGLVGESGCGKTTLGRALMHLIKPSSGEIISKQAQMIFQNAKASLNPRKTIGSTLEEVLRVRMKVKKQEISDRIEELLRAVGLPVSVSMRSPHELSGGQCQRATIARALALKPSFLICDEIVSALDMSIQSQILNLLMDLKEEEKLTYLFISHDLQVIKYLCDRIAVMYLGNIVEITKNEELFENPLHPYTKALLTAALSVEEVEILQGEVSSENELLKGCKFCGRCPMASSRCEMEKPELREVANGHKVACHFV